MLDILYLVFIAPIELCMRVVFEYGNGLTHSCGLALIGVSLVVNTSVLPIYNKAEEWQEAERELKKRMAPKETMIRRSFHGSERFAMISTLYRQYGYSPFLTLRASIGILLQIPFFLAAYLLLSNMPALDGASFGPIRNLGAPDGLLSIGDMHINVLPILMTAINLISAFFYTHNLSRRDKIQLYGMAALFLILLYNSPAGLTFYWTMNNIYSLGKNIVQKDWMKRPNWRNAARQFTKRGAMIVSKFANVADRFISLQIQIWVLDALVGVVALVAFGLGQYSNSQIVLFPAGAMLGCTFLLIIFLGFSNCKIFFISLPLIQAITILIWISLLTYIISKNGLVEGMLWKVAVRTFLICLFFGLFIWFSKYAHSLLMRMLSERKALDKLFFPSTIVLYFLVLIYVPILVFSTDPSIFNIHLNKFVSERITIFITVLVCTVIIGLLFSHIRWIFGVIIGLVSLSAMIFCFIVTPDVGVMNGFVIQKPQALSSWYNVDIDIAVTFVILCIYGSFVYFKKIKIVNSILYASLLVMTCMTAVNCRDASETLAKFSGVDHITVDNGYIPNNVKEFFTFSKFGKNIIVVMLDTFSGANMNQLLERYPELKTELTGFTWYEDVVTGGAVTIYGKPGILGGKNAHPLVLNEDLEKSLEDKIMAAYGLFLKELQDHNFRISLQDGVFLNIETLKNYLAEDKKATIIYGGEQIWDGALKRWEDSHVRINKITDYTSFFNLLGLYNIAPLRLRKLLYDEGNWRNTISRANYDKLFAARALAQLELPLYASSVSDTDENCFIYMISWLPHVPWAVDDQGLPTEKGAAYNSPRVNGKLGISNEHMRTEYHALKALIKWFDWMKHHNVYDNTMIILVADHDACDSNELQELWGKNSYPPGACIQGLLLVKDYEKQGSLKIDRTSQMANWDVPTIIRNALTYDDKMKNYPWLDPSRERKFIGGGHWNRAVHPSNSYNYDFEYVIKGPLLKKCSWTRIK